MRAPDARFLLGAETSFVILGVKFAYSTNGHGIVEFDFITGQESQVDSFPKPTDLWQRFRASEKIEDDETGVYRIVATVLRNAMRVGVASQPILRFKQHDLVLLRE